MIEVFKTKKQTKVQAEPTTRADPVSELAQIFTPDRIEEQPDCLRIDDMYCRVLVADVLPELICFGWLNPVITIGGVTVSVTLHPYSQSEASAKVGRWQTILGADLQLAQKHGETTRVGTLETKYAFYYNLLTDINLRRNNIVAVTVTILITAPSNEELVYKCSLVKDRLGVTKVNTMYYRQIEGLKHTLPVISSLNEYNDVTVAAAVCLSPLISTDFTHPSGIYFGRNSATASPVFLDLFIGTPRLFGPHMFITGTTRSGKSYTMKGIIARGMAAGIPSAVVDPEGEYSNLVERMQGTIVRFKSNMRCMFNLFDVEPEEDQYTKQLFVDLAGKAEDISHLIASMIESQSGERLTAEERAVASKAILDEYLSRGINENPDSLYLEAGKATTDGINIGKTYKEMPTISSYVQRLEEMGQKHLSNILQPFCHGGSMGYFDGQSQGDFYNEELVVFDVSGLRTEFQRMYAMYVMLSWVWEKYVKRSKRRKRVVADEAWLLMRHPDTAKFLSDLARRGAKYNTSLLVASQSFREFTSDEGRVLLAQCNTKFILKMQHSDAVDLGILLGLPDGVVEQIQSFHSGQGILQAGQESAIVRFEGFPFEEQFLNSSPEAQRVG